jgi:hypothetical protein
VLAVSASIPSRAQQSYRSYEALSGQAPRNARQPAKPLGHPALAVPFMGWKHTRKLAPSDQKRFSRPRARAARTELLKRAAAAAPSNDSLSSFSPSQLPGLLVRNSLPAGYIPTSAATGDFNGDGKMDFVVANGGDNNLWVYFGKGDGTFNLPVILPITLGQSPVCVATADLRGIGRMDLIVAEADSNSIGIFLANSDGTFTESSIALGATPITLLIGDFNRDGKPDVVISSYTNTNAYLTVLPGLGSGQFGTPITSVSNWEDFWLSSADFNGDGYPDLLVSAASDDQTIQVYLNNGDATFSPGEVLAQNPGFGDYFSTNIAFDGDGDGIPDAFAIDAFGTLWFFHGNGDGTFTIANPSLFSIGDVGYGIGAADVNGDGHLDVIVSGIFVNDLLAYGTEAGNQICVLEGDGKGNFGPAQVYRGDSSSYSLAIGDFNGDGHPDVITANQNNDSVSVFLNDGTGGYGAPRGNWIGYFGPSAVNAPMSGIVAADVNGDGATDVAFIEWNQPPNNFYQLTVLLNDGLGNLSAPVRSDAIDSIYSDFGDFVFADFRNTGELDFLAIGEDYVSNGQFISFAPNAGGGHFSPLSVTTPANAWGTIGVGDFNGDGKLDFVAAGYGIGNDAGNTQGIQVFLGNGDGTFKTGAVQTFGGKLQTPPAAVYVGDFNRDGKLDLLVFSTNPALPDGSTGPLYELLGNGDGTFQPAKLLLSSVGSPVVADVNRDGHPDIVSLLTPNIGVLGPQTPMQFSIYLGQADGSFLLANTYAPYGYLGALTQAPYATFAGEHAAPMVADFNGDGKLDIAAFQWVGPNTTNVDAFVQFMLGNGDGTFTPTYDVFDFRKALLTLYPVDLLGTGLPQFLELNGYRSTYDVLPAITAPAFQLGLVGDPVPGSTGSGIIVLDVPSSSSSSISLTASDPAIKVPATVTIPAGQVSQAFSFTIGSTFNLNHVFSITGQMGTTSQIAYGTAVPSTAAGFQAVAGGGLASSFPNINLAAGQTVSNLGIGATSTGGYSTTISAQCLGLPSQIQCQFSPATMVLRAGAFASGNWVLSVAAGTAEGSYSGKVQFTDGVITQDTAFTVNVGDFSMTMSPPQVQLLPSDQGSYTMTLSSIQKFDQIVSISCGGLPPGATCSTIPFETPQASGTPVSVGVQTQSVAAGNYTITVTGTSAPVTHTATAQLQVSDFTASVSPLSATIPAGGSANFTVTVSPVNGFNGNVNFTCTVSSGVISASFNPTSATVPANGAASSVLTLTASAQARFATPRGWPESLRLAVLAMGLVLPVGVLLFTVTGSRRRVAAFSLLVVLIWMPSCGGGSSSSSGGGGSGGGGGGSGGGGSGTPYTITVFVSSGTSNLTTKTAGIITLTVD